MNVIRAVRIATATPVTRILLLITLIMAVVGRIISKISSNHRNRNQHCRLPNPRLAEAPNEWCNHLAAAQNGKRSLAEAQNYYSDLRHRQACSSRRKVLLIMRHRQSTHRAPLLCGCYRQYSKRRNHIFAYMCGWMGNA